MNKHNGVVVKSKSISMSETKNTNQKYEKMTRSNAEIKPLGFKKRGVYVEKKSTKISIRTSDQSPDSVLSKKISPSRPIPRPGRKKFVASVLSILSKSTAGTQYPEGFEVLEKPEKKRKDEENNEVQEKTTPQSKRKYRHKSKLLNNNADIELQENLSLLVLQSTKDITRTPSNYSVTCSNKKESITTYVGQKSVNWGNNLPPVVNTLNIIGPKATEIDIIKAIEKHPSAIITESAKRDDKNIYNFFVDLLKTSFSVYNVKTDYNQTLPTSRNSSKVELEIDESVAKRLNIEKIESSHETFEVQRHPSNFYCSIRPDDSMQWDDKELIEHYHPKTTNRKEQRPKSPVKRRRKIKSDSFDSTRPMKKTLPKITSLTTPSKKVQSQKKDLKTQFLNSLKEQLLMRPEELEEPQNFFEALKVIADNKKRSEQNRKKPSEGDVHVCEFKRRRVLSVHKHKGKSKHTANRDSNTHPTTSKKRSPILIPEISESDLDRSKHSLSVFGYDYIPKEMQVHKYEDNEFMMDPSGLVNTQEYIRFIDYRM